LALGAALSPGSSFTNMKREARWSPPVLNGITKRCVELLDSQPEPVDALIYWGATNVPLDKTRHKFPYYIITDGPYDPDDANYPDEWRPGRWSRGYLNTQREVFHGARHVFTLSEWARQKVVKVHDLAPTSVTKLGWGPMLCIGEPRIEPTLSPRVILSVGNEWHRKGMDMVAKAGASIHDSNPDTITMIVGDPAGASWTRLPGVSYIPHSLPLTAVQILMREASVFVVASRFDASPHAIPEAMQYGTPVVATNVCGIPEAVGAPRGGLVINEPTALSLEESIREILSPDSVTTRKSAFDEHVASGGWDRCARILRDRVLADSLV
jgi:glycosyltransferase involved in cell wall biosynthesis